MEQGFRLWKQACTHLICLVWGRGAGCFCEAVSLGYVETIALPGAAAMDVCLPIVEKSTSGNIAVYSFISGLVLSALVPIFVPLILAL